MGFSTFKSRCGEYVVFVFSILDLFSHHPWKRLRVIEICLMFVPTVLSKSKVESDPVAMILYTAGDILLMDKIQ